MRLLLSLLLLVGCSVPEVVKVCRKIKAVGGCDRKGECGVLLEDDSLSTMYFPVVGGTKCVAVRAP